MRSRITVAVSTRTPKTPPSQAATPAKPKKASDKDATPSGTSSNETEEKA